MVPPSTRASPTSTNRLTIPSTNARGDVHTNTLEGFFSIFKRGLVGTYQHMDKKHLDRYLAEFDFRMNTRSALGFSDTQRAEIALKGIEGKRLTYRRPD